MKQYLVEAFLLGAFGGFIGIGVGFCLIQVLNVFVSEALPELSTVLSVSLLPQVTVFGFLTAVLISLAFGIYPATLASKTSITRNLQGL